MAKLRSTKPLSAQTAAHYLTRFKSFSQWLVDDRRAPENLIAHLEGKQITEDDRERERRAFTNEEIERLLLATMSGPVYGGLTGRQRHTLYVIALATAFRAKELASLTPANFHLDALRPFVAVRASNTKNRRVAEQPLPDELVPDHVPDTRKGHSKCAAIDRHLPSSACGLECKCFLPAVSASQTTVGRR